MATARRPCGLRLNVLGRYLEALGLGETVDCGALGLDAEPGSALSISRDSVVRNNIAHRMSLRTNCIPPFAVCMKSTAMTLLLKSISCHPPPAVAWSATRAAETQVTLSAARGRSSQVPELVERTVLARRRFLE